MKIALLGYGKMGQEVEKLAIKRGHEIILILDCAEDWETKGHTLAAADVAIDFSTPDSIIDNIYHCFDAGVPLVTGTTGWHEENEKIKKVCIQREQTLFYSPNFSVGVNLFFDLNRYLATLMSPWGEYQISIEETHHIHKQDSPSGTAIVLANDIIRISERKEKWVTKPVDNPDELSIMSHRTENVPGTHIVKYESEDESISIIHCAKNRKGFAWGVIMAAEWLPGKKGYFEMKDILNSEKTTN